MVNKASDTNMSSSDILRQMDSQFAERDTTIANLQAQVNSLTNVVDTATSAVNYSGISNILDNSLPEWSKDAYDSLGVSPNTAGDGNMEAKDWYRQLTSDTLLSPASATALKTAKTVEPADHSLWAANEAVNLDIPRWNKTNAYMELGGVTNRWDIYYPVPNDIVFPGQRFSFQFEAQLRTVDALPAGQQFYAEFYDNTAGQRKVIEGGSFAITDDNGNNPGVTFGIPGSTSVDYQILARTDSGEEALSNVLNFPNAPAVFDQNNHPRIRFSGVAGFIEFEIYRKIGTAYVLQFTVRNSIDGTYFDIGNPPEAFVSAFPTVTNTKPRAFALTTNFVPGPFGGGFVRNVLTIFVPTTYDRSVTGAGMQYLRFGLLLNSAIARQILIRRIGLSMGDGNWARSVNDTRSGAHSTPSNSGATGSPGGGTGGGDPGGGVDPPPPTGGGSCVVLDTPIRLADGRVPLRELRKAINEGRRIDVGGPVYRKIKGVRLGHVSMVYRVRSANGLEILCTPNEPFVVSPNIATGIEAQVLKKRLDRGEKVYTLTRPHDEIESSRIMSMTEEYGDFTVGEPTVDGGIYEAGGFLLHNKPNDFFGA
jgi:hypothetical protein